MRRILSVATLALALAVSADAAQAQRSMTVGVSGGVAVPFSDLGDTHKTGYNAAAHLGFSMPASPVAFRFEGFYNKLAGKDLTVGSNPDATIAGGAVDILYNFGGVGIRPYVIGGVGSYNVKLDGAGSRTDFGINAGFGAKFMLGTLATFAEARLHSVSGDDQLQYIPITFGIEF